MSTRFYATKFVLKTLLVIAVLIAIFYLIRPAAISLNELFGSTPGEPTIATVELDVSKPKFTRYSLYISPGSKVKFSASGSYIWDPSSKYGPIGPEGATDNKGEPWYPIFIDYENDNYVYRISRGDEFFRPYEPIGMLIAKVGGEIKPIGKFKTVEFTFGGHLELAINERWVGREGSAYEEHWADNSGTITVRMEILEE